MRIAEWPNFRANVTSYKAPKATDFDHPRETNTRHHVEIITDCPGIHFENSTSGHLLQLLPVLEVERTQGVVGQAMGRHLTDRQKFNF